jgi:hypothetical protein
MAGSNKGAVPQVSTLPDKAVKKKRIKMASPRQARLFFLRSCQVS